MVLTADRRLKFSQGVWHCVREYSAHAQSGNVLVNAFQVSKLVRLLKMNDGDLGGCAVLSLCDDFDEFCWVRECRELDVFGTNFTRQALSECSGDVRQIKAAIIMVDKEQHLVKCSEKAPFIVDIAKGVGWSRLSVSGLQIPSKALVYHGEGQCPCHLCDTGHLQEIRLIDHILQKH